MLATSLLPPLNSPRLHYSNLLRPFESSHLFDNLSRYRTSTEQNSLLGFRLIKELFTLNSQLSTFFIFLHIFFTSPYYVFHFFTTFARV